jgi:cytochrome c peroxidase
VPKVSHVSEMRVPEMTAKMREMRVAEMTAEMAAAKMASTKVAAAAEMSTAAATSEGERISCKSCRQKKRGCETEQFDGRARHVCLQSPVVNAITCEASWPLH